MRILARTSDRWWTPWNSLAARWDASPYLSSEKKRRGCGRAIGRIAMLGLLSLRPAFGATEDTLAEWRATYEQALETINLDYEQKRLDLRVAYSNALGRIEADMKAKGKLDALVATRDEQKRFQEEHSLPPTPPADLLPEIIYAQNATVQAAQRANLEKHLEIRTLIRLYVNRLTGLETKYTSMDKLDVAFAARAEADQVRKSAEATAAEFVIADAEQRRRDERKKKPEPEEDEPAPVTRYPPGLVLRYSFDKGMSGRVNDESGKGHNGIVAGAKRVTAGKRGGAYEFDGVDDYIDIGNLQDLKAWGGDFTIATWVKMKGYSSSYSGVILSCRGAAHGFTCTIAGMKSSAVGRPGIHHRSGTSGCVAKTAMELGEWYHVAFTYERGNDEQSKGLVYVNGERDASNTIQPIVGGPGIPTRIGWEPGQIGNYAFNGFMDEFMIFDRVLSDAEVRRLWQAAQ